MVTIQGDEWEHLDGETYYRVREDGVIVLADWNGVFIYAQMFLTGTMIRRLAKVTGDA